MNKIYTYYEDFGKPYQKELIDVWADSWRNQGFDPVVLGYESVPNNTLKKEYMKFVKNIHISITGRYQPKNYWKTVHNSLLAFSSIEEPSWFSDYDCINVKFKYNPSLILQPKVYWRDYDCTCVATGSGEGFRKYIEFVLTQENNILKYCRTLSRNHYGLDPFLTSIIFHTPMEKWMPIFDISRYFCQSTKAIGGIYFGENYYKNKHINIFHLGTCSTRKYLINTMPDLNAEDLDVKTLNKWRVILAKMVIEDFCHE
tara:strand:+ start:2194 stop:2964 length:771 start_codon:yes stop_codon:yes gene_type:complete